MAKTALIKSFKASCIQVRRARNGVFITDGNINVRVPRERDPSMLTLATCTDLLAKAKAKAPLANAGNAHSPSPAPPFFSYEFSDMASNQWSAPSPVSLVPAEGAGASRHESSEATTDAPAMQADQSLCAAPDRAETEVSAATLMEGFAKFALAVPIMLLNWLGGIAAGIWLAVLGEWGIIGQGFLMLVAGGFGLGLVMMPGLLFAAPAAVLQAKGRRFASYGFAFLSAAYTMAVLTVWCVGVLVFFARQADSNSIIPILLWSYSSATGPIAFLAQKDMQAGGGQYSAISTVFAQVSYIIVALMVLLFRVSIIEVAMLFGAIMTIGLIVQFRIASYMDADST